MIDWMKLGVSLNDLSPRTPLSGSNYTDNNIIRGATLTVLDKDRQVPAKLS